MKDCEITLVIEMARFCSRSTYISIPITVDERLLKLYQSQEIKIWPGGDRPRQVGTTCLNLGQLVSQQTVKPCPKPEEITEKMCNYLFYFQSLISSGEGCE